MGSGRMLEMISELGATAFGVWAIKHLVTPVLVWVFPTRAGIFVLEGILHYRILLLTTRGRRSGKERTTPVFYLPDGDRLVICNVNPGFERTNPWVLNLRAHPTARIQIRKLTAGYTAREASTAEMQEYWPRLLQVWPAYEAHYRRSGQRAVFVLEQTRDPHDN